jgi:hypothetical protein
MKLVAWEAKVARLCRLLGREEFTAEGPGESKRVLSQSLPEDSTARERPPERIKSWGFHRAKNNSLSISYRRKYCDFVGYLENFSSVVEQN